ncbi:MAG: bifunctional ornithine acetyltransferase/N-acetylglutamate synthase, partial [Roseovarius sp.]
MGAKPPLSPLAPAGFPKLPAIAGVSFATTEAGVRYQNRTDVLLVSLAPGTTVAGAFTRSATRSAAVLDCQDKIGGDPAPGAAIVVNSGNANAFTGRRGTDSVQAITEAAARTLGIPASRVFSSSTGVIGEPLPHERIIGCFDDLTAALSPHAIETAAR